MNIAIQQIEMITEVATALGDLLGQVVFIGGCVSGLLINDSFTMEQIRYTEDVDVIVNVATNGDWRNLQKQLNNRGFRQNLQDDVICRMRLGGLKVDIMPVDECVLGFSNRWYKDAINNAERYTIKPDLNINIIAVEYFIATKLEAFLGRGQDDILLSHDLEDVLTVFDGRSTIVADISKAKHDVKSYIAVELKKLIKNDSFAYVVQGVARSNEQRENLIFERLEQCI